MNICLLTEEAFCTVIGSDFDKSFLHVNFSYAVSYAALTPDMFTTPLCAQIMPGVVSLSSSDGVGYTIPGDKFFQRMDSAPFVFALNVDPYYMTTHPGGVCSLKVDWSC